MYFGPAEYPPLATAYGEVFAQGFCPRARARGFAFLLCRNTLAQVRKQPLLSLPLLQIPDKKIRVLILFLRVAVHTWFTGDARCRGASPGKSIEPPSGFNLLLPSPVHARVPSDVNLLAADAPQAQLSR